MITLRFIVKITYEAVRVVVVIQVDASCALSSYVVHMTTERRYMQPTDTRKKERMTTLQFENHKMDVPWTYMYICVGIFVTWLQSPISHPHDGSTRPDVTAFANTFVPISSKMAAVSNETIPRAEREKTIFDFTLDRDMAVMANELRMLEQAYKEAERVLYHGSATYEKIKRFVQSLTQVCLHIYIYI
jgi:hypothetical protein